MGEDFIMMKRKAISVLGAFGIVAAMALGHPANAATAASDAIVTAMTPGQIAAVMIRAGFGATIKKDDIGDPMIVANGDLGKFGILFYDCEKSGALEDRPCTDMEFLSIYAVKKKPSLAKLNEWNAEQAFGRAYRRKDGDTALTMPINIAKGVSESFIQSSLEWWVSVMSEFEKDMWPR